MTYSQNNCHKLYFSFTLSLRRIFTSCSSPVQLFYKQKLRDPESFHPGQAILQSLKNFPWVLSIQPISEERREGETGRREEGREHGKDLIVILGTGEVANTSFAILHWSEPSHVATSYFKGSWKI